MNSVRNLCSFLTEWVLQGPSCPLVSTLLGGWVGRIGNNMNGEDRVALWTVNDPETPTGAGPLVG